MRRKVFSPIRIVVGLIATTVIAGCTTAGSATVGSSTSAPAATITSARIPASAAESTPAVSTIESTNPSSILPSPPDSVSTTPGAVPVAASSPAHLVLSDGVTASVAAGAVTGAGTLNGHSVNSPAPPPVGLQAAGKTYELQIVGATLKGEVILSFPARGPAAPAPVLAFYDSSAKQWTAVASTYNPAQQTVTARSSHLSIWSVFTVDTGKLLQGGTNLLEGLLGTSDRAEEQSCPNSGSQAALGISVSGPAQGLVRWCAGSSVNGAPIVKIVDNRGYAIELTYPSSWGSHKIGGSDSVETAITDGVARWITAAPAGQTIAIITPGKGLQLAVPAHTGGAIQVVPSVPAFLTSALLYGVETLAATFDALPWVKSDPTKTARVVHLLFESKDCVTKFSEIATADISNAHAAGALFRSAASLATGCLADQWEKGYGLAGAIGSFAIGILIWFADGVKLVFDGIGAAVDTIRYAFYEIDIRQSEPASPATTTIIGTPYSADGSLRLPIDPASGELTGSACEGGPVTSPGFFNCGSTASALKQCWREPADAAGAIWVDCLRDPRDKLVQHFRAGTIYLDGVDNNPWAVTLADGSVCTVRTGGAWGPAPTGTSWTFECDGNVGALASPKNGPLINQSEATWTALAADPSSNTPVAAKVNVTAAYVGGMTPALPPVRQGSGCPSPQVVATAEGGGLNSTPVVCTSDWATGGYEHGGNGYLGVLRRTGSGWVAFDRGNACTYPGPMPVTLWSAACTSH